MTASATTPQPRALKQLLIERTEGNPFFLEESVRTELVTALKSDLNAMEKGGQNKV